MTLKQFYTGRAIGFVIVILIAGLVALFFKYTKSDVTIPTVIPVATTTPIEDVQPQQITVKGSYIGCLPRHDNFSPDECIEGVKAEDGSYYALDFNLLSETRPLLKAEQTFTASGMFTPVEMLSSDRLRGGVAKGIFSVTKIMVEPAVVKKPTEKPPEMSNPLPAPKCFVGGCSAQICSDQPDMASTCEYREQYACYKTAKCERQKDGQCGWTATAQLKACLAS